MIAIFQVGVGNDSIQSRPHECGVLFGAMPSDPNFSEQKFWVWESTIVFKISFSKYNVIKCKLG